jgi:hypothetical protein
VPPVPPVEVAFNPLQAAIAQPAMAMSKIDIFLLSIFGLLIKGFSPEAQILAGPSSRQAPIPTFRPAGAFSSFAPRETGCLDDLTYSENFPSYGNTRTCTASLPSSLSLGKKVPSGVC